MRSEYTMAKTKRSKRIGSDNWGRDKHDARLNQKLQKQNEGGNNQEQKDDDEVPPTTSQKISKKAKGGYDRSIHLSHDNCEKKQQTRLRLHISKVKRKIQILRERLEAWDELEELRKSNEEKLKQRKEEEEHMDGNTRKKKRGRLGPETWELRGAARPAYLVYDFDTRYIDPHLKAHEDAREKAKRIVNAFHVCKGNFGQVTTDLGGNEGESEGNFATSELLLQTCRSFLSHSMQLALLNLEAKKFKCARLSLMEVVELEGKAALTPFTNARCRLMRLCIEANRPDSARKLWERLPSNYSSVWIRFSAALMEYVSWNILNEQGSTKDTADGFLLEAVRGNVFCAYYIAFHETFDQVFEYTEDIEDADNGSLAQAIEYCNSEQMGSWVGTEGAVDWIRSAIVHALHTAPVNGIHESVLRRTDVEWASRLMKMEAEYENMEAERESVTKDSSCNDGAEMDDDKAFDLLMFSGMFRTGMDMLSDTGALT